MIINWPLEADLTQRGFQHRTCNSKCCHTQYAMQYNVTNWLQYSAPLQGWSKNGTKIDTSVTSMYVSKPRWKVRLKSCATHSCWGTSWCLFPDSFVRAETAETKSAKPMSDLWVPDTLPETDQCDLDINVQCHVHTDISLQSSSLITQH